MTRAVGKIAALAVAGLSGLSGCSSGSTITVDGGGGGEAGSGAAGDSGGVPGTASGVDGMAASAGMGGSSGAGGSGGAAMAGTGTVMGTIRGNSFPVSRGYWIGKPDRGSPPTIFFLTESPLTCADVSIPLWDKPLGTKQVLEIGVTGTTPKTYNIGRDATANYLRATFNPDASGGTVTVTAVNASKNIAGTFELTFGADTVKGTFDAAYCASGVEP